MSGATKPAAGIVQTKRLQGQRKGKQQHLYHCHLLLRTYPSHNAQPECPFLSLPSFPLLLGCCIKNNIAILFTTNLNGH